MSSSTVLAAALLWLAIVALPTIAQRPPVLDTAGRPLRTGTRYYILPRDTNTFSGLSLIPGNNSPCPLYVGQLGKSRPGSTGLPALFLPFVSDETIIREASDFSVSFDSSTTCAQSSTDWAIDQASDPNMNTRTLITTRKKNQPSDFFRILKDGHGYKFHYCPTDVCPQCKFRCGDAGIVAEGARRFLALHVPAFPFVFQRA